MTPDLITRTCVACGNTIQQFEDETAAAFCTCKPSGPQMVPLPLPDDTPEEPPEQRPQRGFMP